MLHAGSGLYNTCVIIAKTLFVEPDLLHNQDRIIFLVMLVKHLFSSTMDKTQDFHNTIPYPCHVLFSPHICDDIEKTEENH